MASRRRSQPRRLPRPATTVQVERDYARQILVMLDELEEALSVLLEQLPRLAETARVEVGVRADAGEGEAARALLAELRAKSRDIFGESRLSSLAQQVSTRTSRHSQVQLKRQVRSALGVDILSSDPTLGPLLGQFVQSNISLITDIPDVLLRSIERDVLSGFQAGKSSRDIESSIQHRLGVSRNRAKLIARDQVQTLNGQVTALRHKRMGVRRFTWRTSGDERVRQEHETRDGQVYEYDNPPDGELPGEPVNCRCYAEPVLTDLTEAAA